MDSVSSVRRGERFRFATADIALEIDASFGGRVVEFSLGGANALFERHDATDNFGSTFWTSPQSEWYWPPPPEIDRDPYAVRGEGSVLALASRRSAALGLSVAKDFAMASDGSVTIDYRIKNESTIEHSAAPWEVTRVPRSGVTFFPRGARVAASPRLPAPASSESEGLVWIEHASSSSDDRKLHADGPATWLAHAAQGLLLVKTFANVPASATAPDESLVEVFVSGGAPYVELEEQGAYEKLARGESLAWQVTWRLSKFPKERLSSRTDLANAVRALLGAQDFGR